MMKDRRTHHNVEGARLKIVSQCIGADTGHSIVKFLSRQIIPKDTEQIGGKIGCNNAGVGKLGKEWSNRVDTRPCSDIQNHRATRHTAQRSKGGAEKVRKVAFVAITVVICGGVCQK